MATRVPNIRNRNTAHAVGRKVRVAPKNYVDVIPEVAGYIKESQVIRIWYDGKIEIVRPRTPTKKAKSNT